MTRTTDPYFFFCPHCGRQWNTTGMGSYRRTFRGVKQGANTGFVAAASDNHVYGCALKTPAERRATNARDEARWLASPPRASRITNNPEHPGLSDPVESRQGDRQGSGANTSEGNPATDEPSLPATEAQRKSEGGKS